MSAISETCRNSHAKSRFLKLRSVDEFYRRILDGWKKDPSGFSADLKTAGSESAQEKIDVTKLSVSKPPEPTMYVLPAIARGIPLSQILRVLEL